MVVKLLERLLAYRLPPAVAVLFAATVYATMIVLILLFWSEPPAPFRYIQL